MIYDPATIKAAPHGAGASGHVRHRPNARRDALRMGGPALFTAIVVLRFLPLFLCVSACFAQPQYEVGATIGYGWYRGVRINAPGAEAEAGIRNRFVAGAVFGEDLYEHFSGEIHYLYHDGDPYLSAGAIRTNVQGQSHTFNYDLLIHFHDRESRFRPYVAFGGGAKYYRVSGAEPNPQLLPGIAKLTHASEWRPLVDWGAGVKYLVREHLILRGDFRDFVTQFPKHIFTAVPGGTDRGLFQQFTPTFGVSYWF
jgi:hypothetical protein